MLSENDEEPRDFVTIYDKDYYPKQRAPVTKRIPPTSLGPSSDYYKNAYNTVYQLNFSKSRDDYFSLYKKRTGVGVSYLPLPDDWVIPETVHGKAYRHPREIMTAGSSGARQQMKKPLNNLDPNMEQRQILKVRTGDTEYFASICSTGDRIVRDNILLGMKSPKQARTVKIDCSSINKKRSD